jgi:proteic killer suppression protein
VRWYEKVSIKSFRNRETWRLFERERSKALPGDVQRVALRELNQIHYAGRIEDLRVPPGNRLEKLSGARAGQHSIRINQRYRVCFIWEDGDAHEVEVTGYH